jgi:integrase
VRGQRIALVPGKTMRFAKSIEIPILPELKEMIERNNCAPFLFPLMAKSYNQSGNKALSVAFGRILKALNIEGKSWHSWRHGVVSKLLNAGIPLSVVGSITGQTLQTLQRYSHVGFDQKKLAMEKMCA